MMERDRGRGADEKQQVSQLQYDKREKNKSEKQDTQFEFPVLLLK